MEGDFISRVGSGVSACYSVLRKHFPKRSCAVSETKQDEFEYKFELLKQEMETLQEGIRTYDTNLFTVKGWAITIFSAFVIFAAQARQPMYLAFCAIAVVLFWLVDAIFKSIQRIYTHRYNRIEQFLQSPTFAQAIAERSFKDFRIPDTGSGFRVTNKERWPAIFSAAIMLPTSLLYVAMLLLTITLFVVMSIQRP